MSHHEKDVKIYASKAQPASGSVIVSCIVQTVAHVMMRHFPQEVSGISTVDQVNPDTKEYPDLLICLFVIV